MIKSQPKIKLYCYNKHLCKHHSKLNKTDLTTDINYVWSGKTNGITQVWGPAPLAEADFLLIPTKILPSGNIPLYQISTYIGDENGNHNKNGKIYWSYCKHLDCLGHGDSEIEAIINCRMGIVQKIKIMEKKKIKLPKYPKIIVKNLHKNKTKKPQCTCPDPKPNGWPITHMHNCPIVAQQLQ